jgi:spermidine synthase
MLGYVLCFGSGFAALVYQIVWQRLLVLFSGSDVHSASIIVAAFMTGLGCGSLAGAHVADRLTRVANLAAFAAAELAIAAFGFSSAYLYYEVLYQRLGHLAATVEIRSVALFVSLLWPTFFMGISLPLLARALTTEIAAAATVTGRLYACNSAGAAAGAAVATWLLLPTHGIEGTLRTTAFINLVVAAAAVPLAFWLRAPAGDAVGRDRPAPVDSETVIGGRFGAWLLMYGFAGFLALSLEIVWFRLLGVILKSTAFTFGTLLSIYLAGIGAGAAAGSLVARRSRSPSRAFLIAQASIGMYVALAIAIMVALFSRAQAPSWLMEYVGRYESLDVRASITALQQYFRGSGDFPRQFLALYFALPALLVGPPTVLMGVSFALLQQVVQTDLARIGHRVGMLLTANIVGSTIGSIATGWILLARLGTSGTLKLLIAASAVFPLWGLVRQDRTHAAGANRATYAAVFAATALLVVFTPDGRSLWAHLHGAAPRYVIVGEDGSGTSVLRSAPDEQRGIVVFVNGVGQSWLPYGGIHTALGALAAFVHPAPRTAAVIGLGSGDTLFGLAGRQSLTAIRCIEIIGPQLDTLRRLHDVWSYPGLRSILRDPRIEHVYGDGRLHLMHAAPEHDIIEADALRPTSAYSGYLYSDAYFALLRARLKAGGIATSWSPTRRAHDTFVKVFPHVLSYGDVVLGSNAPIVFDAAAIRRRLSERDVQAYYRQAGIDILSLLAPYLDRGPRIFDASHDRSTLVDINTDLHPKDEFALSHGSEG